METLSAAEVRRLFDYMPETGKLIRKVRTSNRIKVGDEAGQRNTTGHLQCRVNGRLYLVHRIIWLFVYGSFPVGEIDHIDGDKTNNKICNLRDVSHTENMQNLQKSHRGSKTGLLGAHPHKATGKFAAAIRVNGKQIHLGLFATAYSAHEAYMNAKITMRTERTAHLDMVGEFR
jgi:hypothetical protein